jgi:hypothetical protein
MPTDIPGIANWAIKGRIDCATIFSIFAFASSARTLLGAKDAQPRSTAKNILTIDDFILAPSFGLAAESIDKMPKDSKAFHRLPGATGFGILAAIAIGFLAIAEDPANGQFLLLKLARPGVLLNRAGLPGSWGPAKT